jgi:ankyrin repeat protein
MFVTFTVANRFRWVFCQLEALRYCFPPSVRHMLEELPETLDETYERILRGINKANWDHAHHLLQCLTVAVRPLRVAELAEVLAVDFGTDSHGGTSRLNTDWRWENQQEAVLTTCSSLISVVDENDSQVVQFSHLSVKEFLMSSRIAGSSADVSSFRILLEPAQTVLAKACLGVLLRLDEHVNKDNVDECFPLARYAAKHWVDHTQLENVSSHIREGMEHLFDLDKPHFAAWLQVHDIDISPPYPAFLFYFAYSSIGKSNSATPLYYAALCGFHDLAEQLIIKHPQQVNITGGYYVSPLVAALRRGHLKIAQLLYERGANIDVQSYRNRTLLNGVSRMGHLEIVQWLLSRGANPNVRDGSGWTPLHSAASYGHFEVSRLLLQYKADNNIRDSEGKTPLYLASDWGRVNVVRLLLEHGADANTWDNSRSTPLLRALQYGHLEVARLLVEHGANIDAENDEGRTAFQLASEHGYHSFVKFLLDHGSK